MSGIEQVMFAIGVFASIVGSIAILGLLTWQGFEWWIKANDLREALFAFYWDRLKKRKAREGN